MAKLTWDTQGQHFFETGVDHCVLYPFKSSGSGTTPAYQTGVAWNGVTAITESPSGAEATALYADNIKYLNLLSKEEFACTIEAYTYPDAFDECQGISVFGSDTKYAGVKLSQQARIPFGLAYRTKVGNDVAGEDHGYKLHIVYGCLAAPAERAYATVNESPEAITMSWEVSTTPVEVTGFKPTAHVEIDSRTVAAAKLTLIENSLFGTDGSGSTGTDPTILLPDDIKAILDQT